MKDGEIGVILDTIVMLAISRPVIVCTVEYGVSPHGILGIQGVSKKRVK